MTVLSRAAGHALPYSAGTCVIPPLVGARVCPGLTMWCLGCARLSHAYPHLRTLDRAVSDARLVVPVKSQLAYLAYETQTRVKIVYSPARNVHSPASRYWWSHH